MLQKISSFAQALWISGIKNILLANYLDRNGIFLACFGRGLARFSIKRLLAQARPVEKSDFRWTFRD